MGQVQSAEAAADQSIPTTPASHSTANSAQPSLDSLLAEATAFSDEDANLSLEEKAQKALECPCIAHLRTGPCGDQFSNAFVCFIKSTSEAKGSDCVSPFVYLQKCIKANPDAFPKDVLEDDEVKKEETPSQKIKIQPPLWAEKSKTSNH